MNEILEMIETFLVNEGHRVEYHSPGGSYRDHLSVERSLKTPMIIFNFNGVRVGTGPTTVMIYEQALWRESGGGTMIDSITGVVHAPHRKKSKMFDLHDPESLRAIAEFIEDEPRDS